MSPATGKRAGIEMYAAGDAPALQETSMMSMPTVDPAAADQFREWASSSGHVVKVLYEQGGESGMSLVWSWFGAGYVLPRHSHNADCLYYVLAGEARLGNRTVPAGSGFFVPADAPYAYTAGPDGVQVLEFRSVSSFDMKITEGVARWDQIASIVRTHDEAWKATRVDG